MSREEGVLDSVLKDGTEIRLHRGRRGVRRVPWHRDQNGDWYSGIEGPDMSVEALSEVSA